MAPARRRPRASWRTGTSASVSPAASRSATATSGSMRDRTYARVTATASPTATSEPITARARGSTNSGAVRSRTAATAGTMGQSPKMMPHVLRRLRPTPASTTRTGGTEASPRKVPVGPRPARVAILARSRERTSSRPGQGGPAIARGGRIGRPVRRPSDQQPWPRQDGGRTTREICIQVPASTGAFLVAHRKRGRARGRPLMPATVIVGLQWGDEGKGKTTDFLAEQVAMVVRYQGGDNAGHTVVTGDEVFKLHLVPSGVLYPHITSVIGNGVVVNPATLISELDALTARGIDVARVRVSRSAHVIMPYHVALDRANEARLGGREGRDDRARDRAGVRRSRLAGRPPDGGPAGRGRAPVPDRARPRRQERPPRVDGRGASSRSSRSSPSAWPGGSASERTSTTRHGSSRRRSPAASTSSSRAPRGRSWTSTTGATRTSPPPTRSPAAPAPAAGSARSRSTR